MTLKCPICNEETGVHVPLNKPGVIACTECGEAIALDQIHRLVRRWQEMLAWLDQMPPQEEVRDVE